jgi:hypothetical protein
MRPTPKAPQPHWHTSSGSFVAKAMTCWSHGCCLAKSWPVRLGERFGCAASGSGRQADRLRRRSIAAWIHGHGPLLQSIRSHDFPRCLVDFALHIRERKPILDFLAKTAGKAGISG